MAPSSLIGFIGFIGLLVLIKLLSSHWSPRAFLREWRETRQHRLSKEERKRLREMPPLPKKEEDDGV